MKISACLIAHNEERNIGRALGSLRWVDEIILVDCGSTDETVKRAEEFPARIFRRPNISNLNVNKNYAFDQAASEWVLCLDADEAVPGALAREICRKIASRPAENGFSIKRKSHFFGRILMHGGHYPDRQLRLFRRAEGRFAERHVHERLDVRGKTGVLEEPLEHYPYRSVSHYLEKMDFYTSFEASVLLKEGRTFGVGRLLSEILAAKVRFLRRYVFKLGFLDGWEGFAAAFLDFVSRIVVGLKVRELQKGGVGTDLDRVAPPDS